MLYKGMINSVRDWPLSERTTLYWNRQEWRRLGELGVHGLPVDRQFGGSGRSALDTAIAFTALGHGLKDFGLVFSAAAQLFACTTVIERFAEAKFAAQILSKICEGSLILGNAATESDSGTVLAVTTGPWTERRHH